MKTVCSFTFNNKFKKYIDILSNLKETSFLTLSSLKGKSSDVYQITKAVWYLTDWGLTSADLWEMLQACYQRGCEELEGSRRGRHGSIAHHEWGKHWPIFPPVDQESPVDILPILCKPGDCTQTDCRVESREYFKHKLLETRLVYESFYINNFKFQIFD